MSSGSLNQRIIMGACYSGAKRVTHLLALMELVCGLVLLTNNICRYLSSYGFEAGLMSSYKDIHSNDIHALIC